MKNAYLLLAAIMAAATALTATAALGEPIGAGPVDAAGITMPYSLTTSEGWTFKLPHPGRFLEPLGPLGV